MTKQIWLWVALFPVVMLTKAIAMILAPLVGLFVTHAERTDRVKRLGECASHHATSVRNQTLVLVSDARQHGR